RESRIGAGATAPLRSLAHAILNPGSYFTDLVHILPGLGHRVKAILATLLLYAATLGLLSRPLLFTCAIASLWGMAAFFELVYAGGYRHEGIWLLFLISLYWMRLSEADAQQFSKTTWRFEMVPLYGVLSLILTMNCMFGARLLWNDYT